MEVQATAENTSGSDRRNNFNILRFFAAAIVIYGHMYPLMGAPAPAVLNQEIQGLGVKIFFVISGYLITKSYYSDPNVLRFSMKRFFRIIPGLLFLAAVSAFVFGPLFTSLPLGEYFRHPATYRYFQNVALYINYFLPGVFEHNIYPTAVNGSLWTLPVEVFAYILIPILLGLSARFREKRIYILTAAAALTIAIDMVMLVQKPRIIIYATSVSDAFVLLPYFFIGSLFTDARVRELLNVQAGIALLAVAAMIKTSLRPAELLTLIALPYATLSFALAEKPLFAGIFQKNDYSYGLYLYGFVSQQMLMSLTSAHSLSVNVGALLSFMAALVLAVVSWHFIEKPAQALCKRILRLMKKKPSNLPVTSKSKA